MSAAISRNIENNVFWFPRASVGTESGRASVQSSKNDADVTRCRSSPQEWDAGASRTGSHAGAWEPENRGVLS